MTLSVVTASVRKKLVAASRDAQVGLLTATHASDSVAAVAVSTSDKCRARSLQIFRDLHRTIARGEDLDGTRTPRLAIQSASLMPYKSWMRAAIVGRPSEEYTTLIIRPFGN